MSSDDNPFPHHLSEAEAVAINAGIQAGEDVFSPHYGWLMRYDRDESARLLKRSKGERRPRKSKAA